jgi:hypothetical protein
METSLVAHVASVGAIEHCADQASRLSRHQVTLSPETLSDPRTVPQLGGVRKEQTRKSSEYHCMTGA